ncbi:VWA domain-containing protein [Paenibacillus sp. NPDC058071]|uniref:vWA domain-containing protein n=1 Tax=Paenibacillus sp. NPDC058071 TaxID=3346326 RepID=UPI0036DC66DB
MPDLYNWFANKRKRSAVLLLLAVALVAGGCSGSTDDRSVNSDRSNKSGETTSEAVKERNKDDAPAGKEPRPEREKDGKNVRRYENRNAPVQAGQLTAGEWDDLAAWQSFKNLLNGGEGDSSMRYWSFRGFNRLEVSVTAGGRPVTDAIVQLMDGGRTEWEARTNGEGKAYLFADLFDLGPQRDNVERTKDDRSGSGGRGRYDVVVRHGQSSKKLENIRLSEQESLKMTLDEEAKKPEQVDIMFVIDTTGSMQDELDYLEAELKDVIQRVGQQHGNQLDIRLSANFYRDIHDDYVVKSNPFTKDIDKVVRQIAAEEARGGGDYPEAVEQALRNGIAEHDWSQEARARLLFLVLDAPPHHNDQAIEEVQDMTRKAAENGIRVIPVVSSGIDVDTEYLMRFLSVATGGTYLFLTDDSGIGGEHLEPAAGKYEVKLLNDLLVETINRYTN